MKINRIHHSWRRSLLLLATLFSVLTGALAQQITLKGVVRDSKTNESIIGANVIVKGTTEGTISDLDGNFTLNTNGKGTIVVRYVGYKDKEIAIAGKSSFSISLEEDAIGLGEVVAIGYGSQKKKEVTGAVSSVKSEDFNAGIKTNPVGLLQGKVAGLNIIKTSGDPTDTGYNIQIRGFSTLDKGAGTSPLYIVDGIPVNNIDNISPDEIESMDVLKDGSAAAIYGTRGTNGVIIITTKRGSNFTDAAATKVEYSGYISTSFQNGSTGMATPEQFRNLKQISNGAVKPTIYESNDGSQYNTDWTKELTRTVAFTHNHNLAISGASRNFSYRASVAYKNAEGIAKTSNREEIIAKLAANQKALQGWLDLQYDLSYMHYRNDYFTGDFKQAAIVNPTYPIYDKGTASGYYTPQGTGQSNPVESMNNRSSYQDGNYFRGSFKASLNIKPVPGLKVSGFVALEEGDNRKYWSNGIINSDIDGSGKAGREYNMSFNQLYEATIDYAGQWDKHSLSAVLGFSYQNFMNDGENMSNKGFATPNSQYFQMGNGDASKKYLNVGSYRNSHSLAALFARANYNYDERYLLSASIRREGSSRFGKNNKWGWFPAVSAGWRITGEEFMDGVEGVDEMKIRLGFGVTGNDLNSELQSVAMMSNGGSMWDGESQQWIYTYGVTRNVNPDLRWERKFEYNLGFDFSFLNSRLYGSLDVYYRQTKDLLWDYDVPMPPYQYPKLLANAGQMDSYGVELAITGVPVKTKNWTWATTPTLAFNQNIITKLSDPEKGLNYSETTSGGIGENGIMNTNTQWVVEGKPVGSFYGYSFKGFKKDGTWMYNTPAGGVTSNPTLDDRMVIGNAQPLLTFGWNNLIRYKNLDISIFFRGVIGNKILNVTRWAYGPSASQSLNVFMKDVPEGIYSNKSLFSDYYLEDGSYLKLDNVTVGYTFKFNNKYIESLRLYATGQNLLTITGYSGQDPEVNTTSVWDPGIDYPSFYPRTASILFGVNLTLF